MEKTAGKVLEQIKSSEKHFEKWRGRSKKTVKRYRDDRGDSSLRATRYNTLWKIGENLRPAIYFAKPKPMVQRRYLDSDPVGRAASIIVERCLSFTIDDHDFDGQINSVFIDYLTTGRGLLRADYKYYTKTVQDPFTGEPVEILADEYACAKYVFWEDFVHDMQRQWDNVNWVAFRNFMNRDQLVERFGEEKAVKIKLEYTTEGKQKKESSQEGYSPDSCALIWEYWDKQTKKVYWISASDSDEFIDVKDDPLKLKDFFPVPRPFYATTTTESLVPIPDFWQYQDQAIEIDDISNKISVITSVLNLKGIYAGGNAEIPKLLDTSNEDPVLYPVDDIMGVLQSGGLDRLILWMPIERIVEVISALVNARGVLQNDINVLSGIQDFNADMTATAQKLGAQQGQLRLKEKQKEMARFLRDTLRLLAEIICEQFSEETILQMSGYNLLPAADQQVFMAAVQLLKNEKLRNFRIDIETDSTLAIDDTNDKVQAMEFIASVTSFLEKAIPAATQHPQLAPMLKEMLMFGARQFRSGRPLEQVIEQALMEGEKIETPPAPSEAEVQTKGQMQLQQMKTQGDLQKTQAKAQADMMKIEAGVEADLIKKGANNNAPPSLV